MIDMEIEKAQELGLCSGVKRAIKLLEQAVDKYGEIETLGAIAHNQQLVERLAKAGIKPVRQLNQVQGEILAITTHGISPKILSEIKARNIHIIDTTCSIVRKAQNTIKELTEAGFTVIIFGEAEHSEIQGLLGWAKGKGIATRDVKQIEALGKKRHRLGIISQSTQRQSAFTGFAGQVIAAVPTAQEIRIINTLCGVVQRRQEAAERLAKRSQIMVVIGGHESANTKRLAEICSHIVETHSVETADDIDVNWFAGKQHAGITAGTSTPDESIEEVIAKLRSLNS